MIKPPHLDCREALYHCRRPLAAARVQAGVQGDFACNVGLAEAEPAAVGPIEGILGQLRAITAELPEHHFHAASVRAT